MANRVWVIVEKNGKYVPQKQLDRGYGSFGSQESARDMANWLNAQLFNDSRPTTKPKIKAKKTKPEYINGV